MTLKCHFNENIKKEKSSALPSRAKQMDHSSNANKI